MGRKKKTLQDEYNEGLRKIAFGDIHDAIKLLFAEEDTILDELKTLDLFNISEIKRPKGGGMEIKFFDRIKALEKLGEISQRSTSEVAGFYSALEKGAENAWGVPTEKKDE